MSKQYFGPEDFQGHWQADKKIVYDQRPTESWQAMPIGTGQTGAMVWVPGGIELQVSHTDSFDPNGMLPSLIRLRIDLSGDPFAHATRFSQTLDLTTATVIIHAETAEGPVRATLMAHPERDVIVVEIEDNRAEPGYMTVTPQIWRQTTTLNARGSALCSYDINYASGFNELNYHSGIDGGFDDPLLGLAYGAAIAVPGVQPSAMIFREAQPLRRKRVLVTAGTGKVDADNRGVNGLLTDMILRLNSAAGLNYEALYDSHTRWWRAFWSRSRFEIAPDSRLQPLSAAWHMNRYFTGSSMAGKFPPKFNGSIFLYAYDQRSWGGPYWFQNTRLQYWPLFRTGDIDRMMPFFDIYYRALDYAKARVQSVYGHDGAIFIETMHFWGAGRGGDVIRGEGVPNDYIKNYFSSSLELLMMMLEYDRYMGDDDFVRVKLLPMAEEIIRFFFVHFPVQGGKLALLHAAALETWWDADNPADHIAGLLAVLPRLIAVAGRVGYNAAVIERWRGNLELVPPLPRGIMQTTPGFASADWRTSMLTWQDPLPGTDFLPAAQVHHKRKENWEDPELYAIFPYALYGAGMPDYEAMLSTYQKRLNPEPRYGWSQTGIWAARLGLADEAADVLLRHFGYSANLPGGLMFSPGYHLPGRPDVADCAYFDSPGAMAMGVNEMLVQDHTGEVRLRPAWPADEAVNFKLWHAGGEVVEQNYTP